MASDSDDADFFDKLVDSDSDDDRRPLPVAAVDVAEASAGDLAALTLADQPHPEPQPAPAGSQSDPKAEPQPPAAPPKAEEAAAAPTDAPSEAVVEAHSAAAHPEPEAPKLEAGADVKQVLWNDFGASGDGDPFGAEDAFFEGAVSRDDQSLQASVSAVEGHSVSTALDANANSQLDSTATAMESVDQSHNAQLDSTDPAYWESLYPGWKYDAATQQWYQVHALSAHQNSVELQAQPEPALEITGAEPDLTPAVVTATAELGADAAVVHPKANSETVVEAHPALTNIGSEPPETLVSSLKVEDTTILEGSSPSSEKGTQTAIKQVQWNDFGATDGADLFGDLVADGAEDAFFEGAMPGDQALQSSTMSAVDHNFPGGVVLDSKDNSQLNSRAAATESMNQSNSTQLDSTDPKYWESVYPGWKYDDVTQQWYQSAADNSNTVAALGIDNIQQQQFSPSFVQTSSQSTLETIAEEGSTNAASWGQDGSYMVPTEYPPNMLFYAEYQGWYFDTNTQQWHSLESYQQTAAQTAAALGGNRSAPHTQDSYASSYTQQSQWQPGALGNSNESDGSADSGLLGSFYGPDHKSENQIGQQADAQPLQSSTNIVNTFVPSTSQYTGTDNNQASYAGFQPSDSHQNAYKGLEQSTSDLSSSMGYQSGYTSSAPYAGHHGFKPFTSNQSWNKGFGHSTGQEVGYKGFEPSTVHQTSFEPSRDNQVNHVGFEPSINHGYGNFIPRESMYKEQTHAGSAAHMHLPENYWGTHSSGDFAQQLSIGPNGPSQQFGFSPHEQRSSAGRPPHALVTFGFGGKLVVLKDISSTTANFDSRNQVLWDCFFIIFFFQ